MWTSPADPDVYRGDQDLEVPVEEGLTRILDGGWDDHVHARSVLAYGRYGEQVQRYRARFGPDRLLVVPGIRQPDAPADDQRRTATATEAIRYGADMLVVGRPITRAAEPAAAAAAMLARMRLVRQP